MRQIVNFCSGTGQAQERHRQSHIQRTEETLAVAFQHPDGDMMVRIREQQ